MTELSSTPDWVRDAVFYQIFPDRFAPSARVVKPGPMEPWDTPPTPYGFKGGDLLGIVEHLDYLSDLGINALYLTPIFASASNHRYHTYDYYKVDPLLGGDEALRELLDACHARGMRVVLDGVFNHSGRGFWPFHHVVETGASSPYLDWFYIDRAALAAGRPIQPYPSPERRRRLDSEGSPAEHRLGDVSMRHLGYRAWWDLPALPKLNTNNPFMREHLMGAAEHWLRFGIDGWRLDVAEEIDAGFWREFRTRVRAINPDAYIVAEIWREKPEWVSGDTFDALMNYPLTEALLGFTAARHLDMSILSRHHEYRDFVRPTDGPGFARRLEHIVSMYRPEAVGTQLNLLGSHDTARYVTVASGDRASLRLALLAIMTLPGAPCVYYGDEVGVEGSLDPDCRRSFPWDESRWDHELLDLVRAATRLRAANPVLRRGGYSSLAAEGSAVAYGRFMGDQRAIVVLNAGEESARLSIPHTSANDGDVAAVEIPGWMSPRLEASDTGLIVHIERRSGAVLLGVGAQR
jgi:cyclomaltodextrinase